MGGGGGGVLVFSYSHQNHYIYCSHQAGQLSNLHSLATTNRKPAIFICLWSFGGKCCEVLHTAQRRIIYAHHTLSA